ncbi:MAG: Holliday junction resolvase RuvX [Candidatus Dormibacteria bacterium]
MTPEAAADPGAVLGIDPGSVRVGVAASDPTRTIATPLAVLSRDPRVLWPALSRECRERQVRMLVIGLPLRLDGSEGDAAGSARALGDEASRALQLPVVLWDERLTTAQAQRDLIAAGARRNRRRRAIDSAAATLMLQSWLDWQRARQRTAR